jgi:hypothetical protein
MWEAKNSLIASINAGKPSPLEFARSSNGRGTVSLVDDFGEDPVQRAQQMRRRDLSEGEGMDDFGVEAPVQRVHQNSSSHDISVGTTSEHYV